MPSVTVTPRVFQTGANVFTRNVPGNFDFSRIAIDIDLTAWTSPTTESIEVILEYSADGGATWKHICTAGRVYEAGWPGRNGQPYPHAGMNLEYRAGGQNDPLLLRRITTARITVNVVGAPVTLGATIAVT